MKNKILLIGLSLFLVFACKNRDKENIVHSEAGKQLLKTGENRASSADNQNIIYSVEQLDNTKGLSISSVNCIFQDSQNLIWVGTWDGLNRYNGSDFKVFRPEPGNNNSLSNQVVLKIDEDREGQIWAMTMHGINRYNKQTNTFKHFYFSRNSFPPLSESEFNMALDPQKEVYCAVKDWGIGYFDGTDFQRLLSDRLPEGTVKKIQFSGSGQLHILYENNDLYRVFIKSDRKDKKYISGISLLATKMQTFDVLPNGTVCSVAVNGATSLISDKGIKTVQNFNNGIQNIIATLPEGILVFGKSGYNVVDIKGNSVTVPWLKYLHNHKVTTLLKGNENIIWAGTDGDGIFKIYPQKKSFNLVAKNQIPELDGSIIRTFLKTGDHSFWVGTKGKGLFNIHTDFNDIPQTALSYQNFNESNSLVNNAVFALNKGQDNLIFIGTDGPGLTIYDLKTASLIKWSDIEGTDSCDFFKSVYAICQDNKGFIWLGTSGYGMVCCKITRVGLKLKISDFKRYSADIKQKNALSSNIIFSIIPRNDNQLWIGTRLGGLNVFDKATSRFTAYKNIPQDSHSLSNNDILCLAKDNDNKLWIGTSYGLNLLTDLKPDGKAVFKSYTVKDGLPNNTIHGIIPITASNLWVSTNFGLSNFTTNPEKFTNYSKNEGLQNNEFADGAYYADRESGLIFMGGIKGFNYFVPQKIKESPHIPDLLIDKISGQNQAIPYYQGMVISPSSKTYPSITLKHNQNFFDIHLAALTYTNNEKCQFAYKLNGFDNNWNVLGNRNIISFTNVPRGHYSLWVKWSNADGVWTTAVHAIDIKVKPVWWQSTLAGIIYAIIALSFILFVRSYYLKRQSLQKNILIRKKEEELHENRLTFYTNIAHEFLTPLTLISGPVQKLSEAKDLNGKNEKYVHMIQRNTSRLLILTQQLLEFRKAEYDYLEVTVNQFDFVNLLEQIAELFDDWAIDKSIDYQVNIPSGLPGWYDKEKLEKIVFNLLSNAFKYTPENGTIYLECGFDAKNTQNIEITITNSGKGIPKEKLNAIFDRFFLSDRHKTSDTELFRTGIGLAYVKRLVALLRGEIFVTSTENEKTTFRIIIPCNKDAFSEKEIDIDSVPLLISRHLKNVIEQNPADKEVTPIKIAGLDAVEQNKKKVLIVEDEEEIHSYLNSLLAEKYEILSAYNGIEGLEIIENQLPDIIISDVMMPLMDGVEFCKAVKTNISTLHIPFIMLTAKNAVEQRIEGLESGANSYIPKPFNPDHLLIRVQKLLEEKEAILRHFTEDAIAVNTLPVNGHNREKDFVRLIIDLIKQNIEDEKLTSAFIEKKLGISNSQLYRKTKEIFNLTPGDLIRTIRLKYAAELLRKNRLTVLEVSYKSGFNNRSYFYREFKKMYDTTPKNYQIKHKAKSEAF